MRTIISAAAIAAALIAAPLAAKPPAAFRAQNEVPSLVGRQIRAIQEVHVLGRCLANRNPSEARKYLAAARGSAEEAAAHRVLLPFRETLCPLGASIRLAPLIMRGSVAEAMYKADYPGEPAMAPGRQADPVAVGPPGARLQWTNSTPRDQGEAGERIARCYVGRNPVDVHRFLQTRPGSREELRSLRSLAPEIGPCLPSAGLVTLNSLLLRASLANALYAHVRSRSLAPGGI